MTSAQGTELQLALSSKPQKKLHRYQIGYRSGKQVKKFESI
jgi:hypothetical protein